MTDSTSNFFTKTTKALSGKLTGKNKSRQQTNSNQEGEFSPSADAIFFVRLFARACRPVC